MDAPVGDQRGFVRIVETVDIGAAEYGRTQLVDDDSSNGGAFGGLLALLSSLIVLSRRKSVKNH